LISENEAVITQGQADTEQQARVHALRAGMSRQGPRSGRHLERT
jgi:hypothetical protein